MSRFEPVVWLNELPDILGVKPESVRRMRKEGRLPDPDVHISQRSVGWNLSTLHKAGLNIKLKEELSNAV